MERRKQAGAASSDTDTEAEEADAQSCTRPAEIERPDDEAAREARKKQSKLQDFLSYLETEQHTENIAQVQQQLEEYILREGLDDYQSIKDPQFREFAKDLSERRAFMELCKKAH